MILMILIDFQWFQWFSYEFNDFWYFSMILRFSNAFYDFNQFSMISMIFLRFFTISMTCQGFQLYFCDFIISIISTGFQRFSYGLMLPMRFNNFYDSFRISRFLNRKVPPAHRNRKVIMASYDFHDYGFIWLWCHMISYDSTWFCVFA